MTVISDEKNRFSALINYV